MFVRSLASLAATLVLPGLLSAQSASKLRELSTDRPDRPESPYTVDRAELFSAASTEANAPWVGTVDGGVTYGIGENVQLDAGASVGSSAAAEGVNPFLGLSFRL